MSRNDFTGKATVCSIIVAALLLVAGTAFAFDEFSDPDPAIREMALTYGVNCESTEHMLVFGDLFAVGSYDYVGQECSPALGASGAYTWTGYPDSLTLDSFYFMIVGIKDTTEGSYGTRLEYDAAGAPVLTECPEDLINTTCGSLTQDLGNRCDP